MNRLLRKWLRNIEIKKMRIWKFQITEGKNQRIDAAVALLKYRIQKKIDNKRLNNKAGIPTTPSKQQQQKKTLKMVSIINHAFCP